MSPEEELTRVRKERDVLLHEKQARDAEWHLEVRHTLAEHGVSLATIENFIKDSARAGLELRVKVLEDFKGKFIWAWTGALAVIVTCWRFLEHLWP